MRSFFNNFGQHLASEGAGGSFWTTLGQLLPRTSKNIKKTSKNSLSQTSFVTICLIYLRLFLIIDFSMFFAPLSWCLFGAKGTCRPQFRRTFGAIMWTFWANVEKWKLRFYSRLESKIKLWRACVSSCFVICVRMFSWLVFFMICLSILSHLTYLCVDVHSIFDKILKLFRHPFCDYKKCKKQ